MCLSMLDQMVYQLKHDHMGLLSGAAVHCISVLDASLETLVRFQAVSQPAMIWSPIRAECN
jgi:hypothetical protein